MSTNQMKMYILKTSYPGTIFSNSKRAKVDAPDML